MQFPLLQSVTLKNMYQVNLLINNFWFLKEHIPLAFSTVFPGQLPVCWCNPVKPLKIVDLPTLGFPANAIV